MVRAGSLTTALFAIVLGLVLGAGGITVMNDAGSFGSASAESESGPLGLWDSSGSSQTVNTQAWIGLLVAIAGFAILLFGLRALFVSFEGKRAE